MEPARILWIGRTQGNGSSLFSSLQKRYNVCLAASGKEARQMASQECFQLIVLDAHSMRTPGDRICQELRSDFPSLPLIHLHPGPQPSAVNSADVVLIPPVTPRKLLNVVGRLLQTPADDVITCGPFAMNRARRLLMVDGQETELTPKQALLIEMFFANPGVTLDRRTLMEKVWQTDYLGDTRTLDVHVRWVRQMLEDDPSNPQYLQTVRGVGYRLDVEANDVGVPELA
ncbi:MAG: response regulator transcription factor [Anaerolineae bacterium]|nr:response regulator transcription factor [Anaerolineae bacterium]